jgi:hypothetical protein
MDTREAKRQARRELDSLGLESWKLVLDPRPTRRLGQTRYNSRTIGLSVKFIRLNSWDQVRITVRHEAAHALVGPGYNHGPVWKRKARELGVPTSRTLRTEELVMPSGTIDTVCPTHGVIGSRSRMPKAGKRFQHIGCGQVVRFERKG